MAISDEDKQRMQVDGEENDLSLSDLSDSEDDLSSDEGPASVSKIEWLATGREKRSTAGNRMKSMIAAEEPDDELELLFAEDADDAGFTDVEGDASDAQMSSSEDEDAQDNADELEGEKELEKQARESKQAARKRKAQEAIPLKFRKKVRIDTSQTPSASATPAPKPRPRKKSERLSWLPSPADMPTRASRRETTMAGKEQLHKQMAEREVKRLQQIEAMERKAKKMEALKKPPMTQAERLAEAALVEKRNAKSLNRWEEAEKQREEERKAKLAALNNRTLEGPVVTFWSGVGEWIGGKLKHVGKMVTIEEKPAKKKRHSAVGPQATAESTGEGRANKAGQADIYISPDKIAPSSRDCTTAKEANTKPEQIKEPVESNDSGLATTGGSKAIPSTGVEQETQSLPNGSVAEMTSAAPSDSPVVPIPQEGETSTVLNSRDQDSTPPDNPSQPRIPPPADTRPLDLKPPDLQPPSTGLYTTSMFAPPPQSSLMMPPELKPPSNSFLAPPVGVSQNGLSMPVIGYHSSLSSPNPSHVLAPPNPAQRQSPLSMPQTNIHTPLPALTPTRPTPVVSTPKPSAPSTSLAAPIPTSTIPHNRPPPKALPSTLKSTKANVQKQHAKEVAPPPLPSPPPDGKATRNCIILQNFNENAVKDKAVQTRILFNREMNKLPKQGPAARCVITNHPARYRDPKTGLPYHNAYAFKQIRKLYDGEYKWSSLVGAWTGSGTSAAVGVPARFLDPDAPGPIKEQISSDLPTNNDEIPVGSNKDVEPQKADAQPVQVPALSAPQLSNAATPIIADSKTPATSAGPSIGPNYAETSSNTNVPRNGSQPHAPTTGATFELNTDCVTTVEPPTANTADSKTIGNISTDRLANVAHTPSDVSGTPAVTAAVPYIPSSAPPTVVGQGAVNQ